MLTLVSCAACRTLQHSADAFKEGESVILTMKDSHILDEKGELAEADDELEVWAVRRGVRGCLGVCPPSLRMRVNFTSCTRLQNVQVAELERAEEFKDRKRKLGKPIYSNYDDEETEAGGACLCAVAAAVAAPQRPRRAPRVARAQAGSGSLRSTTTR